MFSSNLLAKKLHVSVELLLIEKMATSDHKVTKEVQHEYAACVRHKMEAGVGSGRPLPLTYLREINIIADLLKQ